MTVYVELVLFNNFAIDLMLIVCTLVARRRAIPKLRVALAALTGAVSATLYAVAPNWARILLQTLLSPIMVAIFFKPQGKDFAKKLGDMALTLFTFVALTFLTGGAVYGMSNLLGLDVAGYAVLGVVALAVTFLALAARAVVGSKSRRGSEKLKVAISANGKKIDVDGLADSGNMLVDSLSGLPVVMLSKSVEERLGGFESEGYIDVKTVGGQGSLRLVRLDGVEVEGHEYKAMGAITEMDGYDVILQCSML